MSEELEQLRQYLETGQLDAAFGLLDEMDEMSRDDKIHKIQSYMHVLLVHLIKQAGGWYIATDELREALNDIYEHALDNAAAEVLDGEHTAASLGALVDRDWLLAQAYEMIMAVHA
jgi:hypothetical protein